MDFLVSNSQLGYEHISAARLNAKLQTGKCLPSRGARSLPGLVGLERELWDPSKEPTASPPPSDPPAPLRSAPAGFGKENTLLNPKIMFLVLLLLGAFFVCLFFSVVGLVFFPGNSQFLWFCETQVSCGMSPALQRDLDAQVPGKPAVIRCLDLGQGLKGHLAPELFIHFYLSTGRAEHSAPSPAWAQGKIPACARSFFMA